MFRFRITPKMKQTLFIRLLVLALVGMLTFSVLAPTVLARTYVIRDGDRVVTCTSFHRQPHQVLAEMGMALDSMDSYTTQPEDGAHTITISRAPRITIHYHGQTTAVTSQGETVGELLSRLQLTVTGEDVVSHGLEQPAQDGMELRIDQVLTRTEVYSAVLPHETTYCSAPSLPEGMEEVLTEGVDGELLRTAEVTYINGKEVSREVTGETVTHAPVTEIIAVGSGALPEETQTEPVAEDGMLYLPTGEVLTYTDTATIRATAYTHTDAGCDMITATGTTVHWGTVAVDPRYIPYGTRMYIVASDGSYVYGLAVAEDCGGDIKGDRMDLYMPTYDQCIDFGRRPCTIYFLG